MNKWQEKKLKANVGKIIKDRDLVFCTRLINEDTDEEIRDVLKEVHKVLSKDPDIIGMCLTAQEKLQKERYNNLAELIALTLIKEIGLCVMREAEEVAKK